MQNYASEAPPNCYFCELAEGRTRSSGPQRELVKRSILRCGELFATPTVSPLRPGHVLVLPFEHSPSFTAWKREAETHRSQQFDQLLSQLVASATADGAHSLVVFEHGMSFSSGTKCGVDHAHTHVMPLRNRVENEAVRLEVSLRLPAGTESHQTGAAEDAEYVALTIVDRGLDQTDHWRSSGSFPSQWLRQLVASAVEPGAATDWRHLTNWDAFDKTNTMLSA